MNEHPRSIIDRHRPWFLAVTAGLMFFCLTLLLAMAPATSARAASPAQSTDGTLPPLPRECGGINPPGYPVPICCLSGYVQYATATLLEPQIVEGATVTLTTAAGAISTTVTAPGWQNPGGFAYFQFDLDAVGVQPGEIVTLSTAYLDRQRQERYQVVRGGQQVDLVLPESRGFDPVTIIVDDQDLAPDPTDPGFYIVGPAVPRTEAECGPGSEFWADVLYYGTTTPNGVGPATIWATYRPTLPVSGTYELFAYAPHGCAEALPQYDIHIPGQPVTTTVVDQKAAGLTQGRWISLGQFDFPAGDGSYVAVDNVTGQDDEQVPIGFDALKWELRTPFPALVTITIDDYLDEVTDPGDVGFWKSAVTWGEATTQCDGSLVCDPIYWAGHIYWTYSTVGGPRENEGKWRPALPVTATYELYAFVPLCFANGQTVDYSVYVEEVLQDRITIDHSVQGGVWVALGEHDLPAGTSSYLYLDDITGEDQMLLPFDAARWILRPPFRPVATIHSISPASAVQGVDVVTFRGHGIDTDDNGASVVAYEWSSNLDGVLSNSSTFTQTAGDLTVGTHVITFRVQDDEGRWSQPLATYLEIQPPGLEESWHFMLYLAGDNNLWLYLNDALNRLQAITPPQGVTITLLFDRPGGGGLWRYLITPGGQSWQLAEGNTGDPGTLANYLLWARENYYANHYYLAIANHGRGIEGLAWDDTSGGDYLTLPELFEALHEGTGHGVLKIDVLHLDACLMDMVEVGYEVEPYADYLVASENLAWALFGYDAYVQALLPVMSPRELATRVAETYHSRVSSSPHTIAALDLGQIDTLTAKVDTLAATMLATWPAEQGTLDAAASQVQRFDSRDYGQITVQDEFVDLHHLAALIAQQTTDDSVQMAAREVVSATIISQGEITTTLVYEQHVSGSYGGTSWDLDNAHGLAIYFPPSSDAWDYADYVSPTLWFGHDTRWDELLLAYLGEPTGGEPPGPPPPLQVVRVYLPLVVRQN